MSNIIVLSFLNRQLLPDLPRFNYLTVAIALLISIFSYIAIDITVGIYYNINVHEYHSYNTYTVLILIMSDSLESTETSVS